MSEDERVQHQAITRLFELVREGRTSDGEFEQLNQLVYRGLSDAYAADPAGARAGMTVQTVAALSA